MLKKFSNWVERHGGCKLTNKILTVCSIVLPAIIGYELYDTGRSQGKYEANVQFSNAIKYAIANSEPIAEVTTKTE